MDASTNMKKIIESFTVFVIIILVYNFEAVEDFKIINFVKFCEHHENI